MVNPAATPLKGAQCVTWNVMRTGSSQVTLTPLHRFASMGCGATKRCKCLSPHVKVRMTELLNVIARMIYYVI